MTKIHKKSLLWVTLTAEAFIKNNCGLAGFYQWWENVLFSSIHQFLRTNKSNKDDQLSPKINK